MHWRRKWPPTPVFLPGESQGQGSLMGCRLWGHTESDTTERLHFHFSLSCIGERNGNPLQCSCLENPRDGEPDGLPSMGSHRVKQLSSGSSMLFSVAKLCQTLCNPMDCSLPGSSVHGIFQARILEWVAISSSRGSSQLRDQTHVSCIGRQTLYH